MPQIPTIRTIVCLAVLFPFAATAQLPFNLQPIPATGAGEVEENEVPVTATITNLTNAMLNLKWERRVISLTQGCATNINDPYLGWAPFVDTHSLNLMPNQVGPLNVNFLNNGAPCSGIIQLKITNLNNLADSLIGVYLFNQSSGVLGAQPDAQIKLFPNPARSYFWVEHGEAAAGIRVLSSEGREMLRFENQDVKPFNIESLPAGIYFVILEDKNRTPSRILELRKQ
ncbi:MAG: T9SS type A sorting domain-containing protein [Saprospiraceae bacterium]|nr:T9SS type A sorting domain-containing protein [Saprospiraceae bacterium]